MDKEKIRESELQAWFEGKAKLQELCDCIENIEELKQRAESLKKGARLTDKVLLTALQHAIRVCDALHIAELLSANRSVAPADSTQMRPDLILFTESAHYILVELKTQPGPERQGVQELLAYSATMKLQMPFVNDIVYIIVAEQWDNLLWHGVRSIIMDGKHVLPLRWSKKTSVDQPFGKGPSSFSLRIVLELFDIDLTRDFEPMHALVPHTLAVQRSWRHPQREGAMVRSHERLDEYFVGLARAAVADCEKRFQTGFALIWSNQIGSSSEIVSLTLATLSQHWMQSENAPSEFRTMQLGEPEGLEKLIISEMECARELLLTERDESDAFEQASANEDASRFFPQNDLSFDVLKRNQDHATEWKMFEKGVTDSLFEYGSNLSVSRFLQYLISTNLIGYGRLRYFLAFGELAEFIRTKASGRVGRPKGLWDFHDLMLEFDEFKVPPPAQRNH